MIEGYVTKQEVVDMLLDLRVFTTDHTDTYGPFVMGNQIVEQIDDKLRGLK